MILRVRDFWTALALIGLSLFFLWKTSAIPLFGGNRAGVSGADWYNSAAIVPLGLFGALLILSLILLGIAIRAGGARLALARIGIGWNAREALRVSSLGMVMLAFIAGLVPRVDFILCGGLLITALIFGYRRAGTGRMLLACVSVTLPALFALWSNLPQADWNAHDDDWLTLAIWGALTAHILWQSRRDAALRVIPVIAVTAPVFLICAMAFGFRQNVPARGGLVFAQIEYHYYVTLRPIWRR